MDSDSPLLAPTGLSQRGKALWEELVSGRDVDAPTAVLVAEMCRCVDRLERLNGILRGKSKEWISLAEQIDGEDVSVVVDAALAEARQQQLALRQLMSSLGVGKLPEVKTEGGSFLDELDKRRRDRESEAKTS